MPIITDYQPKWAKYLKDDRGQQMLQLIVGGNVFHRRKYKGLSQQELAKKAKLTQSIVSELENGDYNPSLEVLQKIAVALDIDYELLTKRKITRKMIEAIDYMTSKIKDIDTLKAMKMLFLIDYESRQKNKEKMIGREYRRRSRGPFNREIYDAESLFAKGKHLVYKPIEFKTYLTLEKDDKRFIDLIIEKFGHMSATNLMEYTYKLEPMKGCTVGGNERMGEKIF
ncbi:MAG: helix-turn-helix domain-containing protein [Candidatus Absconditabacterales bacterium]